MMKTKSLIHSVILVGLLSALVISCKKDAPKVIPTITVAAVTNLTTSSATSGGNISSDGNAAVTSRGVCWSINQNPTTADSKISSGTASGSFTSSITGLNAGYTYYLRAYATNAIGTAYSEQLSLTTVLADIDGNVYTTVTIGTQVWMVENLKTTKYRNGDPIPNVPDGTDYAWYNLTTGAYCWMNNNAASYKAVYGALYNYYAVTDSRYLAPAGWHIPTGDEWRTLLTYIGGANSGGKIRETGNAHWQGSNTSATNVTGFTALPGGLADIGGFASPGYAGLWWSSTTDSFGDPLDTEAYTNSDIFDLMWRSKYDGLSVRCLRD
jgi:uncharacterized protein (TIGR02145 family)